MLVEALVYLIEALVMLVEALVYLIEALVMLVEALVMLVEALVMLVEALVMLIEALVMLVKPDTVFPLVFQDDLLGFTSDFDQLANSVIQRFKFIFQRCHPGLKAHTAYLCHLLFELLT